MLRVGHHLTAVGILIAQHVSCKLNHHHLHTETDAEGRHIVGSAIRCSHDFALDAPLTEPGTDQHACQPAQLVGHILSRHFLAINEADFGLHAVVDTSQTETLANALIGILQVVLAHQPYANLAGSAALFVQEVVPRGHASPAPPLRPPRGLL